MEKFMVRPVGVDLFAGAGGLSLGFEQAGFDVVAAVEVDPIHASVHEFNFPNCAVIPRSIKDVTGRQIRKVAGLGNRRVDVVFGGPPCQGFSMIGRRALDDPRNELVRDFVRIVKELDASFFVFENVKGITVGKHAAFLDEVIAAFEVAGYQVRQKWKVLNAVNFGTPQNRERLILMGAKKGLRLPEYPLQFTRAAGLKDDGSGLREGPSCKEALKDLPNVDMFPELCMGDSVRAKWGRPSEYAKLLRGKTVASDDFSYPRDWDSTILTNSGLTEHSKLSIARFASTAGGAIEPVSRFFKLPQNGVSNTLRAGTDSARGAFTSPRPIHYEFPRCVTVREMARLHGFPDWFRFHTTKWHGARQIGNAVPPPLAKAVASSIIKALGATPVRPTETIALGPIPLLSFDMKEAAAFHQVPVTIAQRLRPVLGISAECQPLKSPSRGALARKTPESLALAA